MGVHVVEAMPGKFKKGGRKKRREAAEAASVAIPQSGMKAPALPSPSGRPPAKR